MFSTIRKIGKKILHFCRSSASLYYTECKLKNNNRGGLGSNHFTPSFSSDNTYIEVLDSTRVHPETYEWARKMAVDALEYDEVRDHCSCGTRVT